MSIDKIQAAFQLHQLPSKKAEDRKYSDSVVPVKEKLYIYKEREKKSLFICRFYSVEMIDV